MIPWLIEWITFLFPRYKCKTDECTELQHDHGYCRTHAKWLRENTTMF